MNGRRIGGTLLGMALTVIAWSAFSVSTFGARLGIALVGFAIGHATVRLIGGAPSKEAPPPRKDAKQRKAGNAAFWTLAAVIAAVTIVAVVLRWVETRKEAARARAEVEAARVIAPSPAPSPTSPPSEPTATNASFANLAEKLAAIAAAPGEGAEGEPMEGPNGTSIAMYDIPGCTTSTFVWDPKKKDAWGFNMLCPELTPKDLAPEGGVDAIDATYLVIKTGPLAGVLVDRNLLDPSIWTIATVARRMTYDASMFVFCAENRVPGRTSISPIDFRVRCKEMIEKKIGRAYCKYEPDEGKSGYDCSRTWETKASCGKELFDENKVTRSFSCTWDPVKATLTLKP